MTKEELQSFLPQKPERLQQVADSKRQQLVQASYDVIGCIHEVYKQLGGGLPEYIYQEALSKQLKAKGLTYHKEMRYHPLFNGEPLEAFLKMDLVVESSVGNIIVECKALTLLTEKEHYQTSMEIGEMVLFPAVRDAVHKTEGKPVTMMVAAPGTSCRQQILDGTGIHALHPIQIMLRMLKN